MLNRRDPIILLLGDLVAFFLALLVALVLRYAAVPSFALINAHLSAFVFLWIAWVLTFFIAGLYEKHTLVFKGRLPSLILNTQIANSLIAVVFFYLFPVFGIAPKTILVVYLAISFAFVIVWRVVLAPRFGFRRRERAILIGAGAEMEELKNEVNKNDHFNFFFVSSVNLDALDGIAFNEEVIEKVYSEGITSVVIDLRHGEADKILPALYNLIFSNVRFLDMHKVYEEVFDRVPLSLIGYTWFLENISFSPHTMYDPLKRLMDISISLVLGIVSLVVYPFVALAIKLEDGGKIFLTQHRIGEGGKDIYLWKFRSMTVDDSGAWHGEENNVVTRVGKILRKTRIDELPQLWNIVRGDMSLIGPRPDIIDLGKKLAYEIPYYTVRNLIKPGLSGWAQIKQDIVPHSVEETRDRLAYDLYYLKNRSFILDLTIALKTMKTLLSRMGR